MVASTSRSESKTKRRTYELGSGVAKATVLVGMFLIWQITTTFADSPFFPTPVETANQTWDSWLTDPDAITDHLMPSMVRLLIGWGSAVVVGIAVGVMVGLSVAFKDYVDPVIQFLRSIPPPALIPLFIVLLGIDDDMKVTMIFFGVIWPIILNTVDGVQSVDALHLDTGRAYGVGRWSRLFRIILPSAAPKVFAGMRISLSIAVILMVISEMVATTNGVGFTLVQAQRSFRYLDMWGTILLLGIIGYVLNTILQMVEHRVLAWQIASGRDR